MGTDDEWYVIVDGDGNVSEIAQIGYFPEPAPGFRCLSKASTTHDEALAYAAKRGHGTSAYRKFLEIPPEPMRLPTLDSLISRGTR